MSRTVICLAFRFAGSPVCSNHSRSCVRLIEHVIELLPNHRTRHRHLVLVSARGRPDHRLEPLGFLIFEWPFASTTCAVSVSLFGNLEPVDAGLLLTECLGHANPDRRFKPDH